MNKPRKCFCAIAAQQQALAHQLHTKYGHREGFHVHHRMPDIGYRRTSLCIADAGTAVFAE
jgi:hypothetical protein